MSAPNARPAPVRTILAATDFSTTAAAALRWAAELARAHRAKIVVAHALAPPIPPAASPDFISLPPDFHEQYREAALRRLTADVESVRAQGVEAASDLDIGPAAPLVLEIAQKHAADLIVVGTRGLTGFRHLVLGSTAERLVQTSTLPVLTVHPEDAGRVRRIKTILVPTDFSDDAALAIRTAERIFGPEEDDAKIVLVHAYHLPVEFTALGAVPVAPRLFADAAEQARERLEEDAKRLRSVGVQVETIAQEGYPPLVIEEAARNANVDLIAMGTHGRTGLRHLLLGSTAERVVQHAPCPVLTIRRPA
ncbi:Universal stress protein/MSMEI_3859 [Myxococcaceae bacterium]|jgi:nucleotide-binding universal stress UspA family protein|nr:Universal stress protein/MSMEI_3859 [Myxococcaceae bacterium]